MDGSNAGRGSARPVAHALEAGAVQRVVGDLDPLRDLVRREPFAAELLHSPLDLLVVFGSDEPERRYDDAADENVLFSPNDGVFDVLNLNEQILDLGREHLLSGHVDDLRIAAKNT